MIEKRESVMFLAETALRAAAHECDFRKRESACPAVSLELAA
jgi:hypothetical protein